MTRLFAASLLLSAAAATTASAQFTGMTLIKAENFDSYTPGDLGGQGGWVSSSANNDVTAAGKGLIAAGQTAYVNYGPSSGFGLPSSFTFNTNGQPTNGVYYYTLQIDSAAATQTRGNFSVFGGFGGTNVNAVQNGWGVRLDNAAVGSDTMRQIKVLTPISDAGANTVIFSSNQASATTFNIYGKLSFNSTSDVYSNTVWVNPTDTSSFAQIAATAAGTGTISGTWATTVGGNGTPPVGGASVSTYFSTRAFSSSTMTYDNVALYAIPEPSTYAAIFGAVALGAVILRRRRSAR